MITFSKKFAADGTPLPVPGLSVLALPYPVERGAAAVLEKLQQSLKTSIGDSFIGVPADTFHVTTADLKRCPVSDRVEQGAASDLRRYVERTHDLGPLLLEFNQLELFGEAIVAKGPWDPGVWPGLGLEELRDRIYASEVLKSKGVERPPHAFRPHITLGYLCGMGTPTPALTQRVSQAIEGLSVPLKESPVLYVVSALGLFSFEDMMRFKLVSLVCVPKERQAFLDLWRMRRQNPRAEAAARAGLDELYWRIARTSEPEIEARLRAAIPESQIEVSDSDYPYERLLDAARPTAHWHLLHGNIAWDFTPGRWDSRWEGYHMNGWPPSITVGPRNARRLGMPL